MKIEDLVTEIVRVSEKAACLARAVSSEEALFKLLIEEKTGEEKNKRFVHDFKTLADVLVQETVRHDLTKKFPSLADHIHGEESNTFKNTLGESVTIEIKETIQQTAELLSKVLDENEEAAMLLANVIHQSINIEVPTSHSRLEGDIPEGSIGLWIDPIDSTSQYIHALPSIQHKTGVYTQGLQSVLVLIGVYCLSSGLPVIGVINQPFTCTDSDTKSWKGTRWWGVSYGTINVNSLTATETRPETDDECYVVISASESDSLCKTLSSGYTPVKVSGGGYKLLCVVQNLVPLFLLSRPSCYKWDTCSPHAILSSLGGGVLDLRKALHILNRNSHQSSERLGIILGQEAQIRYNQPDTKDHEPGQKWSNSGGILAYRDISSAIGILQTLAKIPSGL